MDNRIFYYKYVVDILKHEVNAVFRDYVLSRNVEINKSGFRILHPIEVCQCKFSDGECNEKRCTDGKNLRKRTYELLKTGIFGLPSMTFWRFHEQNKTKTRNHIYADPKLPKLISGFNAFILYLCCIRQKIPRGKEKYILILVEVWLKKNSSEFCERVLNNNSFWLVQVDIHTYS